MAVYPHHESLHLTNFTTFADATFEFSPTINVLVGENGTGKTHLMKVLYSIQYAYREHRKPLLASTIAETFASGSSNDLIRNDEGINGTSIEGRWGGRDWTAVWNRDGFTTTNATLRLDAARPVFIPTVDMIGHTRRFVSTYDEYDIDFDQTHRDIVSLLLSPERKQPPLLPEITNILSSQLGGTVEEEGERFYLRTRTGRQPMPLVAEGLRKIATLYQLLRNGFLEPGSVLFWDEPEGNVNPKLMDEIVDVLLRLARSGVQIFLATHSYVLLKEFDIQARADDGVRYFGLERTDAGTVAHATDDYTQIRPNPIAEQFDYIYDRELTRAIKGGA